MRYIRVSDLETRVVGDEMLVHDRLNSKVHVLNKAAGEMLQRCETAHSSAELTSFLCERYAVTQEVAALDVERVIKRFCDLGLVDVTES